MLYYFPNYIKVVLYFIYEGFPYYSIQFVKWVTFVCLCVYKIFMTVIISKCKHYFAHILCLNTSSSSMCLHERLSFYSEQSIRFCKVSINWKTRWSTWRNSGEEKTILFYTLKLGRKQRSSIFKVKTAPVDIMHSGYSEILLQK